VVNTEKQSPQWPVHKATFAALRGVQNTTAVIRCHELLLCKGSTPSVSDLLGLSTKRIRLVSAYHLAQRERCTRV